MQGSSHAAVDQCAIEHRDGVPVVQTVAGVADVEERLVVVGGKLSQPRYQLVNLSHTNLGYNTLLLNVSNLKKLNLFVLSISKSSL